MNLIRKHGKRSAAGFTLTELLITIAIVGVASAIGIPMLQEFTKEAGVSTQADLMLAGLNQTRSEAVKRNGRVTMCRSTTGTGCAPAGDWKDGWIVFLDSGEAAVVDGADEIIRVQNKLSGKGQVTGTANVSAYISYAPNGQARMADNSPQTGTLSICSDLAKLKRRKITLSPGTGWVGVTIVPGAASCST